MSRHVLRSTMLIGLFTGLSRLAGLGREIFMAVLFGTTLAKTAFDVAFQIPNLFRNLLGEGALSSSFVPVFSDVMEKEGAGAAHRLAGRVMTLLGVVLAGVVAAGWVVNAALLAGCEPGGRLEAVLILNRIMMPYVFFICLSALCGAILNSFHRYAVPAATPVVMNLVLVGALAASLWAGRTPWERIQVAAWGVLAAGALQILVQLPALRQVGFRALPVLDWRDAGVRRVLGLMGPVTLGLGVFQINVFVDSMLALTIAPWAPAALTYAQRLLYLPLGLFATAMGTVLLPTYSRMAARDDHGEMLQAMNMGVRHLMVVMIPASVALCLMAEPIVRLVFVWGRGVFGDESVVQTARALRFYAPGLVVFSMVKVIVPFFYALKDTRTPVRVAVRTVALNFALNVAFILTWPEGYQHAGLAMASVLSSAVNCAVLGAILHRRVGSPGWREIGAGALRTALAAAVMGVVLFGAHRWLSIHVPFEGLEPKVRESAVVVGTLAIGGVAYMAMAGMLCRDEFLEMWGRRGRKPA